MNLQTEYLLISNSRKLFCQLFFVFRKVIELYEVYMPQGDINTTCTFLIGYIISTTLHEFTIHKRINMSKYCLEIIVTAYFHLLTA